MQIIKREVFNFSNFLFFRYFNYFLLQFVIAIDQKIRTLGSLSALRAFQLITKYAIHRHCFTPPPPSAPSLNPPPILIPAHRSGPKGPVQSKTPSHCPPPTAALTSRLFKLKLASLNRG